VLSELSPMAVSDERLALSIAVGAAERRVYLSYPRLDLQQARPRVPSFYDVGRWSLNLRSALGAIRRVVLALQRFFEGALEAMRAAEGRLPNFAELDRRAEAESSARVGWPAPKDPGEAIDHAEYDLAVLDRFLSSES
jgi:ATP-dependent helicase/nuclease subunit B